MPAAVRTPTFSRAIVTLVVLAASAVAQAQAAEFAGVPSPEDDVPYGAYGISVGARIVAASGSLCPDREGVTCVLGTGGGFALRASRRWPTGLGIEGGYEVFAHNTGDLYDPGLVQALFASARAEVATAGRVRPFGRAGIVLAALGDSFAPDTAGAGLDVAGGLEVELSQVLAISVAGTTRALWFLPFETQDGVGRSDGGVPTLLLGIEVGLVLFPD